METNRVRFRVRLLALLLALRRAFQRTMWVSTGETERWTRATQAAWPITILGNYLWVAGNQVMP